ncbi:MAG: glycosyltransferase family 2 protein [Bacteroidota bacterium]
MQVQQNYFNGVGVLITHYNRSKSLERLLKAFHDLNCSFEEIVVSDDGSRPEHLEYIKRLQDSFNFKLVTTDVNMGLGNNINKGQDAVTAPLTLYVQEDFEPSTQFVEHFSDALHFMKERDDLDIIRFYAYFKYPYTKPYQKGFSEMVFRSAPWYLNHLKFHFYSDHPHLRRSDFFSKFGRYREGISGDKTEYSMSLSFIKHKAKGLFYDEFTTLFYQKNNADEPSTMGRAGWREGKNPLILFVRFCYLQMKFIKCTLDLLFY